MFKNIYETIGNTPLVELKSEPGSAKIFAKIESRNPSGSVKDRPVKYIVEAMLKDGTLEEGGTIIEATSGNTGIALSMIGAALGIHVMIVMPETMTIERRNIMKAYGAELVLTPGPDGMQGAVDKAKELSAELDAPILSQFTREANVQSHVETTGQEILKELDQVDGFVAGFGTGGTVTGVSHVLKKHNPDTQVWAMEPAASALISQGQAGPHKIQGLGANFVPDILDQTDIDKVMTISNEDAIANMVELAKGQGILAGVSSGANYAAAKLLAKELGQGKQVVTVLPDTGERYLSAGFFDAE
ncbi:cysteine synthase A [Eremococcus coleocola]|uniref:cysteine synthase A n=1 Tax=Eremococcus coleocola TaxID=88132 RepID=UPI00041A2401|nr:cysteine synthase A [Eremococcus coleocola]